MRRKIKSCVVVAHKKSSISKYYVNTCYYKCNWLKHYMDVVDKSLIGSQFFDLLLSSHYKSSLYSFNVGWSKKLTRAIDKQHSLV
jgi:hypothetical protein